MMEEMLIGPKFINEFMEKISKFWLYNQKVKLCHTQHLLKKVKLPMQEIL